jgi:RNA polymerase sigma-70 factor (ECF subfamily)
MAMMDTGPLLRHRSARVFRGGLMDDRDMALTPEILIDAVGRGSEAALKRLYELESRRLFGIALRIVRQRETAADVLQETFIQVWQNATRFSRDRGTGAAWLTGIVRFRALDAVRKLGREIPSDDPLLGDETLAPDVIEKIDAAADATALRRCLELLDEQPRHCILLAFIDGLSHSEIAERIKAPLGSVKSWVRRGLLSLRSCLQT